MRAGESVWCAILAGIITYELCAAPDELLTDATERVTARHPIIVRAAIIITAAHLLRILPRQADPFTQTRNLVSVSRCVRLL